MSEQPPTQGTMSTLSGVSVDMPGTMGPEQPIGGWPNLVQAASLALQYMNEIADPRLGYLSYVGAGVARKVPSFTRCLWDWTEASSYALCGRIGLRRLTGSRAGEEVEIGQRKLTLASFHNLDGFSHRTYCKGWCEDISVTLWQQARVMFTLMSWFLESEDERILGYLRGMVQGLLQVSRREGRYRVFSPGWNDQECFGDVVATVLVEPLLKYHEVSGDSAAFEFCEGMVNWQASPESHLVDNRGRTSGSLRALASGLAGMARFAEYTRDERLLDYVERIFRDSVAHCAAYGATPDTEPCCTNMELTTVALALTKAGRGEWWDMIDRLFRNQTLASQFTDPTMVNIGSYAGDPEPFDDTRDILKRSLGGFTWSSAREHFYGPAAIMLCCAGNAMWTLGKIVSEAATLDERGLSINLHYSVDTPLAAITHHEPFEGRLEVVPHRAGKLRVRVPAYADKVEATVDGIPAQSRQDGSYLAVGDVRAGAHVALTFSMPERSTEEITWDTPGRRCNMPDKEDPVVKERINVQWRGNTVLAIGYDDSSTQPLHRLYLERMGRYRRGEGRDTNAAFFLPAKEYHW